MFSVSSSHSSVLLRETISQLITFWNQLINQLMEETVSVAIVYSLSDFDYF